MKIVSYNISDSQPWKIERLLAMDADVWVVPEITCPAQAHLSDDLTMEWEGIDYKYRNIPKWKGYAYTNVGASSIRLFPWDKQMSDHIGMEVTLE